MVVNGRRTSLHQTGISLVEILVVLVIVSVLMQLAVPVFGAWIGNVQIRSAAESLENGLQLARAEAIRRNRSTVFWLTAAATQGNPASADWMVACAPSSESGSGALPEAPGDCPGPDDTTAVPAFVAGATTGVNWIRWQFSAAQQTAATQLSTTPSVATLVTFNSLGMVVTNTDGSASLQQIDITNPGVAATSVRPLRVLIGGGGVRLCDPALLLANDPRGCT
jgi:type IV fimbrial biogenesis protein FimT